MRGGKVFHIEPCIWIFSGTEDPSLVDEKQSSTIRTTDKKSDFVSRLSLGIMDIRRPEGSTKGPIENVYMGVNIIINEYPDVRYISDKVLMLLHALPHDVGVRTIKNLVKSFTDIQYGEVWTKNISETKIREIMGEEKFNVALTRGASLLCRRQLQTRDIGVQWPGWRCLPATTGTWHR